jgi:hypothetical protein
MLTYPPDERPQFPTRCRTFSLTDNLDLNYHFGFNMQGAVLFPGPPSQAFQFFPQAYDGDTDIRGIPCNIYKSCLYNPATKSNFTAVHYFSSKILA